MLINWDLGVLYSNVRRAVSDCNVHPRGRFRPAPHIAQSRMGALWPVWRLQLGKRVLGTLVSLSAVDRDEVYPYGLPMMTACEGLSPVPPLLRFVAVMLCAVFLLDSLGHVTHAHNASGKLQLTADVHGMPCGFCATFGGLVNAPQQSRVRPPSPLMMRLVQLPELPAPLPRLHQPFQPRGPPAVQRDLFWSLS